MSAVFKPYTLCHVFDPRRGDLEIGPRTSAEAVRFWKDLGFNFADFCLQQLLQKSAQKHFEQTNESKNVMYRKYPFWGAGPAECTMPGDDPCSGQKAES